PRPFRARAHAGAGTGGVTVAPLPFRARAHAGAGGRDRRRDGRAAPFPGQGSRRGRGPEPEA
ncbi:MAG: hypothetical protein LBT40_18180, partial [Deltaproteobacteria bacterium]|nr:hypothetical protein [Deltaproteobacteria bacterium]